MVVWLWCGCCVSCCVGCCVVEMVVWLWCGCVDGMIVLLIYRVEVVAVIVYVSKVAFGFEESEK